MMKPLAESDKAFTEVSPNYNESKSFSNQIAQCHGDQVDVGFALVQQCIINRHKVLVLMRGLSGSGKTTLAKKLAVSVPPEHSVIYSTDDYFIDDYGEYHFDHTRLNEAHLWNQARACAAVDDCTPLIIIDNTNIDSNHMLPYARYAALKGYEVYILVPTTPWAFKPAECANKSSHNVQINTLKYWKENYLPVTSFGHLTGLPTVFGLKNSMLFENVANTSYSISNSTQDSNEDTNSQESAFTQFESIETDTDWTNLDKDFFTLSEKGKALLTTFDNTLKFSQLFDEQKKRCNMSELRSVSTQVEELALYIACSAPEYEQRQMAVELSKSCTTLAADESVWLFETEEKPRQRPYRMINRATVTTVTGYPIELAVLANRFPMAPLSSLINSLEGANGNMAQTVERLFEQKEAIEYVDNRFHLLIYDINYAASLYAHIENPLEDQADLSFEKNFPDEWISNGVNIELKSLSERQRWREALRASNLFPFLHADYVMRAKSIAWTCDTAQAILDQLLLQLADRPALVYCCSSIKHCLAAAEQQAERKNMRMRKEQMRSDELYAQQLQDSLPLDSNTELSSKEDDRTLIFQAYPGADPSYLEQVFYVCNCDVRTTLDMLKFAFEVEEPASRAPTTYADYASRLAESEWPSLNNQTQPNKNSYIRSSQATPNTSIGSTNIAKTPLKGIGQPQIDSATYSYQYDCMRQPAFELKAQALEYKARANEYQNNGRPNEAFYYRCEAAYLIRKAKALQKEAISKLMDERDALNAWNIIDVHGLHAEEAVQFIARRLQKLNNDMRWHKDVNVTIITGHGKNSQVKPTLQPAVRAYLTQHRYCFTHAKGHFVVRKTKK